MNRLSIWIGLGCLLWAGQAVAQGGGDFAQPEPEPPEGEPLRQDRDVWLVDIRAAFPGGLPIGGQDPAQQLYVYRQGIVSLSGLLPDALLAQPAPLADLPAIRIIAPFWSDLDRTGCRTARAVNEVYVSLVPDALRVTWHEALPAGCDLWVEPASFALEVGPVVDDVVHVAFHYLAAGQAEAYAPPGGPDAGRYGGIVPRPGSGRSVRGAPGSGEGAVRWEQ